jgi:hypothetical protein
VEQSMQINQRIAKGYLLYKSWYEEGEEKWLADCLPAWRLRQAGLIDWLKLTTDLDWMIEGPCLPAGNLPDWLLWQFLLLTGWLFA